MGKSNFSISDLGHVAHTPDTSGAGAEAAEKPAPAGPKRYPVGVKFRNCRL
jgi:hypothetical protein